MMKTLYCKKINEELFDLKYKPLELLKQEHGLEDLNDSEAVTALLDLGYYAIRFPDEPDDGYRYLPSIPELVDEEWQVILTRVDEVATTEKLSILANTLKIERSNLLARSDWTQLADVPLSVEKKQAWEAYRQALRDITSQDKFPWRVEWPTPPL